jgi:putative ABC transport system substrate-binding protein
MLRDSIVTIGTPAVRAAKEATASIPIIMAGSTNPIARGLVDSLAHPGGNITGVTRSPGPTFAGKALQLLKEAAPNISRIAWLTDSSGVPKEMLGPQLSSAAAELKLTLLVHDVNRVNSRADFDMILSEIFEERADAILVAGEFLNVKYQGTVLDFVSRNKLPSMTEDKAFVEQGLLLYYLTETLELRRRAAVYVDKIFKGAKPADLPIEEPSRFELIVNMKTAVALGLTIPQSIMGLANKIIE